MFGLGLPEILVILVILLVLFGAKRIPEIGSSLGKTIRELGKIKEEGREEDEKGKKDETGMISDLKKQVEDIPGLKEAKEIKKTADKVRNITRFFRIV